MEKARIYPILNEESLIKTSRGKINWQKSFPQQEGEELPSWKLRLRGLRSSFSYRKSLKDESKKKSRAEKNKAWKRANQARCKSVGAEWYDNNRAKVLFLAAKKRAAKKKVEFSLSLRRIESSLRVGVCEATGLNFDVSSSRLTAFSPSLDRVNSKIGYVDDNVMVVCWGYNAAKNAFDIKEFIAVAEAVCKNKKTILEKHKETNGKKF